MKNPEDLKTVGVVGAGTMGLGIAQVCAGSGYHVLLFDINPALLQNGVQAIARDLDRSVAKNKLTKEQRDETLQRIKPVERLQDLLADIVVEAVAEKLEIKQKLFLELEQVNSRDTILATNTSSLSITQIAGVLQIPGRFLGLHFFNPAPLMKLVEIVAGTATDPSTITLITEFARSLHKTSVVAQDSPGFIVNRVARHYYLEGLKLLEENVAEAEAIDEIMRSAGFKMGPFELMDLIGIDINLAVTQSVYLAMNQAVRFRPNPIQQQKVAAGQLGKKTGKGFYEYPQ